MELYKFLTSLTILIISTNATTTQESHPIVDLGYSVYQATFNVRPMAPLQETLL